MQKIRSATRFHMWDPSHQNLDFRAICLNVFDRTEFSSNMISHAHTPALRFVKGNKSILGNQTRGNIAFEQGKEGQNPDR